MCVWVLDLMLVQDSTAMWLLLTARRGAEELKFGIDSTGRLFQFQPDTAKDWCLEHSGRAAIGTDIHRCWMMCSVYGTSSPIFIFDNTKPYMLLGIYRSHRQS